MLIKAYFRSCFQVILANNCLDEIGRDINRGPRESTKLTEPQALSSFRTIMEYLSNVI